MQPSELEGALEQLRSGRLMPDATPAPRPAECLRFTTARLLALNPSHGTAQQRSHVEDCTLCTALLASFRKEMPHLPVLLLVRRALGLLTERELQLVSYHLEQGECTVCRQRAQVMEALGAPIVALRGPGRLPAFSAVGAAEEEFSVSGSGPGLEADLFIGKGTAALEIRTRDAEVALRPVAYELRSDHGTLAGVVRLEPDVQGWYTALVQYDTATTRPLEGSLAAVMVASVPLEALTYGEQQLFAGSAGA